MRSPTILVAVFILASTVAVAWTVKKSDRISTPLQACEFNSISANYLRRPTSVAIELLSTKQEVLRVQMQPYARSNMFPSGYEARFDKNKAQDYAAVIDKFLKWARLATERGDQFTKEIDRVPAWRKRASYKFTFHSGNATSHYLVVTWVFMGTSTEESSLCFNVENAQLLRQLLVDHAEGKLSPTDIDAVYK